MEKCKMLAQRIKELEVPSCLWDSLWCWLIPGAREEAIKSARKQADQEFFKDIMEIFGASIALIEEKDCSSQEKMRAACQSLEAAQLEFAAVDALRCVMLYVAGVGARPIADFNLNAADDVEKSCLDMVSEFLSNEEFGIGLNVEGILASTIADIINAVVEKGAPWPTAAWRRAQETEIEAAMAPTGGQGVGKALRRL